MTPEKGRKLVWSSRFKKDYKKALRQGRNLAKLEEVADMLANDRPLPASLRDHALQGKWKGYRECHLSPDWLLIYKKGVRDLAFVRIGSHSELFDL